MKKLLSVFLLAGASAAQAICTSTTINQATAQQIRLQMTPTAISTMLGCNPVELPAPAGTVASTLLAWGINDGVYHKQISVDFAAGGGATRARYQEIPLAQAGGGQNNDRNLVALALLAAGSNYATNNISAGGLGVCTPATINPGAVQLIRPHMNVAAVSGVLGCGPTELPPPTTFPFGRWIWAVPRAVANSQGLEYQEVGVAIDEVGVMFAIYTFAPLLGARPGCNGALRVEPPTTTYGNWVPGTCP